MVLRRPSRRRTLLWLRLGLVGILLLLLLCLLSGVARFMALVPLEDARWPLGRSFLVSLGQWAALVPFTLVMAQVVRRTPLDLSRWRRVVLRHGVGVLVYVPAQALLSWGLFALGALGVDGPARTRELLGRVPSGALWAQGAENALLYTGTIALLYVWNFFRRERVKERQLAQAQLQVLRMQLNPQFLFNSLGGAVALLRRDVDAAERLLLGLTGFLHTSLDAEGSLETSLARELDLARRVFEVEELRRRGGLTLEVDAEPRLLESLLPSFVLQPLLEHALGRAAGAVAIRAQADGHQVRVRVEDDGPFLPDGLPPSLLAAQERLAQLYGDRASLEAGPREDGGGRVTLRVPRRRSLAWGGRSGI